MEKVISPDDRLCWKCVGETFLSDRIRNEGTAALCIFCSQKRKALSIEDIADAFELAFDSHYYRTRTGPTDMEEAMYRHGIATDFWYRDGEPVLDAFRSAGNISLEVAEAIQDILESRHGSRDDYRMQNETDFDSDSHYEESKTGPGAWHELWSAFELELKERSRYFSTTAQQTLDSVFNGIEAYQTQNGDPIVVVAGPNKPIEALFRARVFHDRDQVHQALEYPDVQIGPPPARLATAGRMNPTGIAFFYGALKQGTAISEVGPAVGSTVVVAKFRLLRNLRLLDLALLSDVQVHGSIFDPEYLKHLQRVNFLGALGSRMVAPVLPKDEALDYLPTQVVCDYLASRKELLLDGIIYASVQAGYSAKNVVLFHHASRVEEVTVPQGAKISAYLSQQSDDEDDVEYQVTIEVPAKEDELQKNVHSEPNEQQPHADYLKSMQRAAEKRLPSLSVEPDSLEVHEVTAVSFITSDFKVKRHQFLARPPGSKPHPHPLQSIEELDLF